ncbi:hypothetical protein GCM10027423_47860 [Spirosoma arcticum]
MSILSLVPVRTFAQKIDNLHHNPFGTDVVLSYDLTGTLPSQQFLVKATCQNGPQVIELQTTEGNGIGRVRGGAGRQIIWHVLRDVPELVGDNITFTVTAVILSEQRDSPAATTPVPVSVSDRKAALYNELTAQTDTYLEQVYNECTAFTTFGERAFESRTELARIDKQVTRTNEAYEKLLQNKETFKQRIRSLWGNEKLNADADLFFSRSLDQMHRTHLLPFNETLKRINDVASGKLKTRERTDLIKSIKMELQIRTSMLLQEINSVKGDAKGFYANLYQ